MLEHYQDAVRQERRQWMQLQGIVLERKGYKEVDWTWLDELEWERWGSGGLPQKPQKTQRELLDELRAKGRAMREVDGN